MEDILIKISSLKFKVYSSSLPKYKIKLSIVFIDNEITRDNQF